MKFSIDSYTERTIKEEPYNRKLTRAESFRDEATSRLVVPEKPVISKSESFSLTRFNVDSTISGKFCKFLHLADLCVSPISTLMSCVGQFGRSPEKFQ